MKIIIKTTNLEIIAEHNCSNANVLGVGNLLKTAVDEFMKIYKDGNIIAIDERHKY